MYLPIYNEQQVLFYKSRENYKTLPEKKIILVERKKKLEMIFWRNVFLLMVIFCGSKSSFEDDLLSVIVLFRHGDRTISRSYPTDPYKNMSFWPGGFGQLTKAGIETQYNLGRWFRQRYDGFLPAKYSLYDIYVRSTDVDRTLMSAAAHLAGLYPPVEDEIWNPKLLWQPIPVHTVGKSEDSILGVKPCPKFNQLLEVFYNSTHYAAMQEELKDLYDYISLHTGHKLKTLQDIEHLHNILYIEESLNYTIPEWTKRVYPEPLGKWGIHYYSILAYNNELARLSTGPFLNEIIEHFTNVSSHGRDAFQRYKIYSAHDGNIMKILKALNVTEFLTVHPPFGASLIFELRRGVNEARSYVNVLYKMGDILTELKILGCHFNCDLDQFIELIKPVAVPLKTWNQECLIASSSNMIILNRLTILLLLLKCIF